jgi:hypothetical protein
MPAQIGISALFASILVSAAQQIYRAFKTGPLRLLLWAPLILLGGIWLHGCNASIRAQRETEGCRLIFESVAKWSVQASIDDAKVGQQHVILVNAIEHTTAVFLPFVRYAFGHPLPLSYWTLSGSPFAHDVKRTAIDQLDFSVLGDTGIRERGENFYRDERAVLKTGLFRPIDGLAVELINTTGLIGRRFRFTFAKPLEDPSYLFLYSTRTGIRRFPLPAVGETRRIPRAPFPDQRLLKTPVTLHFRDPKRTRQNLRAFF